MKEANAVNLSEYSLEQLVDLYAARKDELDEIESILKNEGAALIEPGKSSAKIEGALNAATVTRAVSQSFPDDAVEEFWNRVGAGKAKQYFDRQTKVVYKKITDAVDRLLGQPVSDPDLQDGKQILKKGMEESETIKISVKPLKK